MPYKKLLTIKISFGYRIISSYNCRAKVKGADEIIGNYNLLGWKQMILSQNFIELLNDKYDYNVIVEVENKEKSFMAHYNVIILLLENIQPNENNIKVIANELELVELSNKLEILLIETKGSWLKTNFTILFLTKKNFKDLEIFCNDIVVKVDLQMKETKIWEYTIKYFHISSKDILDKKDLIHYNLVPERPMKSVILPARTVLVPELPARVNESFSTIISDEHAAEISFWIDLIIIKVANTDEILGGYNPLMWDKITNDKWMYINDSFIFSLKNGNIQNSIEIRYAVIVLIIRAKVGDFRFANYEVFKIKKKIT
ncbi:hypothetical protein Glove_428g51 [Diversispora epigaea]|uniref:BTB domain-containing protein n=1 Tax=Diversispora epigaea TaxID=1348612 RepID=A0A397H1Q5_9GLOM|nr:hypothetical protein Glove_428g51 [Diversispora epigaea]